jgi:hypothetical protein
MIERNGCAVSVARSGRLPRAARHMLFSDGADPRRARRRDAICRACDEDPILEHGSPARSAEGAIVRALGGGQARRARVVAAGRSMRASCVSTDGPRGLRRGPRRRDLLCRSRFSSSSRRFSLDDFYTSTPSGTPDRHSMTRSCASAAACARFAQPPRKILRHRVLSSQNAAGRAEISRGSEHPHTRVACAR